MFDFRKPFYFIRDPEIIKQLAVKDFDHFENHRSFIDEDVDLLFVIIIASSSVSFALCFKNTFHLLAG